MRSRPPIPPIRVVVTGAESTGKSTLAAHLAQRFDGQLVPERLRTFVEESGRLPTAADMELVARQHCEYEDALLAATHCRLVVYDTDLYTIVIYTRRYFGSCPPWIEAEADTRQADLYLLLAPDIPWIPDPQREGPQTREKIQQVFESTFAPLVRPGRAVRIDGDGAVRRTRAELEVARVLATADESRIR
jgi:nicotinamide riboside kinase